MNLDKAQLLLDKINRLYKSMSLDPKNVATIEKDLMRDYIKQLYEAFLKEEMQDKPLRRTTTRTAVDTPPIRRQYVPPVERETPREEPIIAPPPVEHYIAPPPVERIVPPPPVEEVIIASTPPPPPVYQPKVAAAPTFQYTPVHEEYEQLFHQEESNELSHKLSSLPISDLNKAMGINERIFTINELFRGDSMAFKHTINTLNGLASFEEAKKYLAQNIAGEFEWTNKSRRNKAKNFIKLVKRRYI